MIKILKEYEINDYLTHEFIDAKNSYIYHIKTKSGEFILKSQKDNQNFLHEIEYEKIVTDYLYNKGINCQRVLETKNKKLVIKIQDKEYHLLTYIEGKVLHDEYNKKVYMSVAKNIALMQNTLLKFKIKDNEYEYLNVEKFIKDGPFKYFTKKEIKDYYELVKDFEKINYKKLRKCIIHGDLSEINIMQHDGKFSGFIDFSYPYNYYLIMDLAYYIANCIIEPAWIKDFFTEYNKIIKLNEEEKKALYYFIKMNLLRKDHLTRDSYPIFNKLAIKDFIKLIN